MCVCVLLQENPRTSVVFRVLQPLSPQRIQKPPANWCCSLYVLGNQSCVAGRGDLLYTPLISVTKTIRHVNQHSAETERGPPFVNLSVSILLLSSTDPLFSPKNRNPVQAQESGLYKFRRGNQLPPQSSTVFLDPVDPFCQSVQNPQKTLSDNLCT